MPGVLAVMFRRGLWMVLRGWTVGRLAVMGVGNGQD